MGTTLPNLGLYQPGGGSTGLITPDEVADIDRLNDNFKKIDDFAGTTDDRIVLLEQGKGVGLIPVVADKAARDALFPSPIDGNRVYRKDTKVEEYFDSSKWWRADDVIVPAAAQGHANCTVAADGTLLFAAVPANTYVGADGVFTSKYRAYEIAFGIYGGATQLVLRLATGGSIDVAGNYMSSYRYWSGQTPTGAAVPAGNGAIITAVASTSYDGSFQVFDPSDAARNTALVGTGLAQDLPFEHANRHNVLVVDDGFRITTAGVFTGWLRIRGVA